MHQRGDQEVYQAAGMAFYLYLPTGEPTPDRWPVLLFLHGVGEASWNWSRAQNRWEYQPISVVKRHGSPPALCEARNPIVQVLLSSFIVVSPQCPYIPNDNDKRAERRNWHWVNQVNMIDQILSAVIAEFGGDPGRIYASGFSRGGLGALEIAPNLRNQIAKLVAVDSESIPGNLPPIPIWVHYGGLPTFGNIYRAHQPLVNQLAQGWDDAPPNAPAPVSRRPFTTWNRDHPNTCTAAYSDPRIYEWLLR